MTSDQSSRFQPIHIEHINFMTSPPTSQPFIRNRLTWLGYIMLAYVAFSQSILGPLMPSLRDEFQLNYTLAGILPAAIAIGLICSGLVSDWLARHSSRRIVFWGGGVGLALSVVALGLSSHFAVVVIAVLGMGFGSSLAQVMIQAFLSDQHEGRRAVALTEANVAASFSASLTPLAIGIMQRAGLDWRVIGALAVAFLLLVAIPFYRDDIPDHTFAQTQHPSSTVRLPLLFWLYWTVLFMVVAIEMTLAIWGTDFLANVAGLSRADAILAFGSFPAAMLIGRITGSRLTRCWSSQILLPAALGITLIGFPIFWLTPSASLNIIGLFITGLGIANLYPLTLSIAVGLAAGQSNQASARASLGVGTALLTAPVALGWLADRVGLQPAFGLVIVLALSALAVIMTNNRRLSSPTHASSK
jgi:fucose permease